MKRIAAERANKLLPMRLYEVTYRPDENSGPLKVRLVASDYLYAATEIYKRRYKGDGKKKHVLSVDDLGAVVIAEPHRKLDELLSARADQIGALVEAIERDIANLEFGATILEKHRVNIRKLEELRARLSASGGSSRPTNSDAA